MIGHEPPRCYQQRMKPIMPNQAPNHGAALDEHPAGRREGEPEPPRGEIRLEGVSRAAAIVVLWLVAFGDQAFGSESPILRRGPYLQRGTPTSVIVRWRTDQPGVSRVRYGTNSADLTAIADAATAATNHAVILTNLVPDTFYWYAIGTPATTLAAGTNYFFRTAPPAGSRRPLRIWVLGDSGYTNQSAGPVRDAYYHLPDARYTDVWLMLGDNAYTGGGDGIFQHAVFNTYPTLLRQTVLWSTIGNQETASSATPPASGPTRTRRTPVATTAISTRPTT